MTVEEPWWPEDLSDDDALLAALHQAKTDAVALLQRDPAAAPDDPRLIGRAMTLGGMVCLGPDLEGFPGPDGVLAWVRYAEAASQRLLGPDSSEAVNAVHLLLQILERRRDFTAAFDVKRRIIELHLRREDHEAVRRHVLSHAELLQSAGQCVSAAAMLRRAWHEWRRQHHGDQHGTDDPAGLDIGMRLVVMLASCGQTDAALQQLTEAAPYRPASRTADFVRVQLHYSARISLRRTEHRPHCTWAGAGAHPDIDWVEALRR